mmetsp:Transcript_38576/g.93293  ORF Transcript_38576/g.93293 Transcript_38576/m.93293 type:complete len:106 (-) Transcript_38576:307-624(-)
MPISIKKIMTMSLETVQKTTNRFSSPYQEWYAFPSATASLSTTAGTSLETTQNSDSNKNLLAVNDDSLPAPPRKGSWDNSFMPKAPVNKEERDLESMIQCTSPFC